MIRFCTWAVVGAMIYFFFMPGAGAVPCSAGTTSMNVTTTAELHNMIDTINCTGEGTFEVTWTGSLQLGQTIELADNKKLTVTGTCPVLSICPNAVIDAESGNGIFKVSNGSTLSLNHLVLLGGASENGAAIDARSFSSVHVAGCSFFNNNSTRGGPIFSSESELHIDADTVFADNPADLGRACEDDLDCGTDNIDVCSPVTNFCEDPNQLSYGDLRTQVLRRRGKCKGDPHMTGFHGQKFDFTGEDNGWYAIVSDLPYMHLNMRVTSPVPSVPEITYITGISIVTTDADGLDHTIVIAVSDPHGMESSCPVGIPSCLADGALNVVVDGEEVMLSPGEVMVTPDVAIAAVNLPGACRSFGFETYWERKKLELLAESRRTLKAVRTMRHMSEWILSDPTATNIMECAEYVTSATAVGGIGLFAHQSEHASFQIMTPAGTIRLSHGRMHQLPKRDPTDQFDLPDHLAWQMDLVIDDNEVSLDATGILGETFVPTVDDNGAPIMHGMDAIRGQQEDYRVKGPLGVTFTQSQHHE